MRRRSRPNSIPSYRRELAVSHGETARPDWNNSPQFNIDHHRAHGGTINFPHSDCIWIEGYMPPDPGENLFAKAGDQIRLLAETAVGVEQDKKSVFRYRC